MKGVGVKKQTHNETISYFTVIYSNRIGSIILTNKINDRWIKKTQLTCALEIAQRIDIVKL